MTQALLARAAIHITVAFFSLGIAACTMKSQEAPPLGGPSEFGQSITVSVSPDVLSQDGASQSLVAIAARGSNGEPLRNVSLRAEIRVGGVRTDFGSLSARNVVTGSDGRATLVYTAPAAPAVAVDDFTIVDIVVVPIGADFNNSASRVASIRLVPPGVVIPPDGLKPAFTLTPTAPLDHQNVLFDASTSQPVGNIAEYRWSFGDGDSSTGRTAVHAFDDPGTFAVTLTISDAFGRTASVTQSITVGAGAAPTAAFVFSPTAPLPGQQVNFNASASRATPGQSIVTYSWDFGDRTSGQGVQPSHTFAAGGTYNVTLVITDSAGRVGSVTQAVAVGTQGNPTASFVFSPTNPRVGDQVSFNASASSASPGRTIVSYRWDFGDGTSANGQTTSHVYTLARTYTVVLTVTDDTGKTATSTVAVTIAP